MSNQTFLSAIVIYNLDFLDVMNCNFIRLNIFNEEEGLIRTIYKNTNIENCFFYGCNSYNSDGIMFQHGSQSYISKCNFFNTRSDYALLVIRYDNNTLDHCSYMEQKFTSDPILGEVIDGLSNINFKNLNISNANVISNCIYYEIINFSVSSYIFLINCSSNKVIVYCENPINEINMFFKYVSIVNAKAITCFACYTKFAYFENIYFKNITNNRNAYFVSTQYIEVKNIFSDNLFAILGNYSAQAISTNYTEIVPFSGYYEEAVLNYLKEETYIDTNKYQSEPIIVQDIKGEFKLDKVIFRNITSSNNGGSISICCFSSNICITNCEFDQCVTNTYTKKTCGGAIYIIGHKTFTSITNVIGENCFAGRGHFCDIYSNYPTSITKATIIKCTPYSHFSESTTNYIYYDNIFNSCNISNNCMGENMHFSDFSSKFTDCVIASNTLIQGISYIKSSSLSLTSCIVYKNSYDDDNESTVSTFEYDNLELHDCYLLIEQSFNFSDSNVTNCSINNETIDFVHNLAISKQIGCDTKLIHITISKFSTWKIIVIVLSVLVFIAIITISIAIYHQCKLKRLEKRNNLSTLLDGDFG